MPTSKKIFIFGLSLLFLLLSGALYYVFHPPLEIPKNIGILFYQNTPTAALFLKGFTSSLANQGYYPGKNLKLFVEDLEVSGQSIEAVLKKIERNPIHLFITTGKDLTLTVAHKTANKPIIYALVSRPIREETIKTVIDKEDNITGVSYFTPYDRTLELCKRIIPRFRKLTILLPKDSSWMDLDRLKAAATDIGVELTLEDPSLTNLTVTIEKLSGQTDAVYLPNDIGLIRRGNLIKQALLKARLPAISNNLEFKSCSILTYYAEPETMGEIAGRMAVKIFHRARMEFMPVELSSYFKLSINSSLFKELNMKIDEDILSYANEVIQ